MKPVVCSLFPALLSRIDAVDQDFWALLIAGSRGVENYRHQADVCHTYNLFSSGGFNMSNVVVMMYDDVAWSSMNPLIGRLFNEPNGPNVYDTCRVDISGEGVNAQSFTNVLTGSNDKALRGGSLQRILSRENSTVFISFVDHGEPGRLLFPTSPEGLTGAALLTTVDKMTFKKLVIYVEACFSGSVLESLPTPLPKNVIAVTASNATESSWGTYCPTPKHPDADAINGVHIGTCLGDLFEVTWKRDLEARLASGSFSQSTLGDHIEAVRTLVSRKSNVMVYGDTDMLTLPLSEIFPLTPFSQRNGVPSWEVIVESAQIQPPKRRWSPQPWQNGIDHTLIAT